MCCMSEGVLSLSLQCNAWRASHRAIIVLWSLSFLGLVVTFGSLACLDLFGLLRGHTVVRVVVHEGFAAGDGRASGRSSSLSSQSSPSICWLSPCSWSDRPDALGGCVGGVRVRHVSVLLVCVPSVPVVAEVRGRPLSASESRSAPRELCRRQVRSWCRFVPLEFRLPVFALRELTVG